MSGETDEESGVLYDVLVFREWAPSAVEDEEQPEDGEKASPSSAISPPSRKSGGWTLRDLLASAALSSSQQQPYAKFLQLQEMKMTWALAVTSDCSRVAVAQVEVLEILSHNTKSYIPISRVNIPPDRSPHLRLLNWSPEGTLLVLTSSSGRVFLYDEEGNLMFSLVSSNLPSWDVPSEERHNFCQAFFSSPLVASSSSEWITQLSLVDFRGRMSSFLLSATGYQEAWSVSLSSRYPSGITDAVQLRDSNLLYVAGPDTLSSHGMTCWRILDEHPYVEEVQLADRTEGNQMFWKAWLKGSNVTAASRDFVYQMVVSPDGKKVATAHISGTISVWALPSLMRLETIPLQEQPCHDDISPQFLQKPDNFLRSFYENNTLKWHPIAIRWWDGKALIVSRYSGGLTIMSLEQQQQSDEESKNLLGDSAEFFSPSHKISQCFESGFFVLECEPAKGNKPQDGQIHEDEEAEEGLFAEWKRKVTTIFGEKKEAGDNQTGEIIFTHRLLYFQSTSPEELFQKKIINEEYGEAIVLARHYSLDCDRVYERQWKLSNHSTTDIDDYLSKIKSATLALNECLCTIPGSAEATEALLKHGLRRLQRCDLPEDQKQDCQQRLTHYLDRLSHYLSVLSSEKDFSPAEYNSFRSRSLLESADVFASEGNVSALMTMFDICEEVLSPHLKDVLSKIPESLDPLTYASLLADVADDAGWFNRRAEEIMNRSNQVHLAISLLNIGTNLNVEMDKNLNHLLCTFQALTVERQELLPNLSFAKVGQTSNLELLHALLQDSSEASLATEFKRFCLPFLDRAEQCQGGECVRLVRDYLLRLASDSQTFYRSVILMETLHQNMEETWLTANDLLRIGLDMIYHSSKDTDLDSLCSFLSFLRQHYKDATELSEIAALLNGLKVLRRHKLCVAIEDMKRASSDKEVSEGLVTKMLAQSCKYSQSASISWNAELCDVLSIQEVCHAVLTKNACLQMFCQSLLDSESEENIRIAMSILKGTATYIAVCAEVEKTLSAAEIKLPKPELIQTMCETACEKYVVASRDCSDKKLKLANLCLLSCQTKGRYHHLLEATYLVHSTFKLKFSFLPKMLLQLQTADDISAFTETHLVLQPMTSRLKDNILDFVLHLARANCLEEVTCARRVVSAVAQTVLRAGDHASCEMLCDEILLHQDASSSANSWEVCYQLALQHPRFADPVKKSKLLSYCLAFCDHSAIEAVAGKNVNDLSNTEEWNAEWIQIPGHAFYENSLFFGRGELGEQQSNMEPFGSAAGGNRGKLSHANYAKSIDSIFMQDPLLAACFTLCVQSTPSSGSSDITRLLCLLNKALLVVWPSMGKSCLDATVLQLLSLVASDCSSSLAAREVTTTTIEEVSSHDALGLKSDHPPEQAEVVAGDEEAVAIEQSLICQKYRNQQHEGVPRSLRTLFSNL